MGIGIKVTATRDGPPMRSHMRSTLAVLGNQLSGEVRARTAAGVGEDGRKFARGRFGPSNLIRTGAMVGGYAIEHVDDRRLVLAPAAREQWKAVKHQHGEDGRPRRPWAGLSKGQIDRAVERIADAYFGPAK